MSFLRFVLATTAATNIEMDGVKCVYFKNKWYIYGGWNALSTPRDYNTQYSSLNLITWTKERNADWNPSHAFGLAHDKVNDILYKIGSDGQPETTPDDRGKVWKSVNGINWTLVSNQVFFQNIQMHFTVCKGSDIYVGGGHLVGGVPGAWTTLVGSVNTKVWKSSDGGKTFVEIATGLMHLGGNLAGQVIYSDTFGKFIALCVPSKYDDLGRNRTYSKGFWTSQDAIIWTQQADFYGLGRQYADLCDDGEFVWMINGGVQGGDGGINSKEMWYYNGSDWAKIVALPLEMSHATGIASDGVKVALLCGNMHKGVYYLEKYNP